MAIEIKHTFVSAKGDGSDATLVRPSNWNATHNIEQATNNILGRLTLGPGATEELPVTPFMINLLNTADLAALSIALGLPTTGDAKLTYKVTADPGWIMANDGTIGDVLSGSSVAAANTSALFTHFYNTFSDAVCPLQTSGGIGTTRAAQGTAAQAFIAKCRMVIPKNLGRAILIAGTGAGLTARGLAGIGGFETHTLTQAEAPDHVHFVSTSGSGSGTGSGSASVSGSYSGNTGTVSVDHAHSYSGSSTTGACDRSMAHTHSLTGCANLSTTGGGGFATGYAQAQNTGAQGSPDHLHGFSWSGGTGGINANHTHGYSGTVNSSGSCSVSSVSVSVSASGTTGGAQGYGWQPHNNMQPWTAWNIMIRL